MGASLREQWVITAGPDAADAAAVRAGLAGRPAGQRRGDSLGHAGGHAAGDGRRRAARRCGTLAAWAVQALAVFLRLARRTAVRHDVDAGAAGLGRRRGRGRRRAAGDAAALARCARWACRCCCRCCCGRRRVRRQGQFELLAADIGQGNAVLVRTAAHALVYDSGPRYSPESDAGHRVLVPLLRALDERVDTVMLSHRDTDHTGGAAAVLAMQPQAALLSSIEDDHPLQALRPAQRCARRPALAVGRCRFRGAASRGRRLRCREPAQRDELRAAHRQWRAHRTAGGRHRAAAGGARWWRNRVARVAAARRRAAGAAPRQQDLVERSLPRRRAAALALVQAGYRNRFGHPAPASCSNATACRASP